ncbi:MAG: L-threonylcarbamoyladenylate synthase [Vampirovibrionales bacterium]|nr:L-threonylcarbamoyladenylate synthase [Vampirovibrionales bacterium]
MVNSKNVFPLTASSLLEADVIARAVDTWRAGQLVAFPTETVYGLGADAQNPEAVAKIFALKNRPPSHPLIVHVAHLAQVFKLGITLSEPVLALAQAFWPGPLTLIVKRPESIADCVSGGRSTVGIRLPAHPVAQRLLERFDGPIAAPSANRFGQLSPTRAEHVRMSFHPDELPCVVDGGLCQLGLESTIIDTTQPNRLILLRPGNITPDDIQKHLISDHVLETPQWSIDNDCSQRAPSSGTLVRHYCPKTPLHLVKPDEWATLLQTLACHYPDLSCLGFSPPPRTLPAGVVYHQASEEPSDYGASLYDTLHRLDKNASLILVEEPPNAMGWQAVRDRLNRAATAHLPHIQ